MSDSLGVVGNISKFDINGLWREMYAWCERLSSFSWLCEICELYYFELKYPAIDVTTPYLNQRIYSTLSVPAISLFKTDQKYKSKVYFLKRSTDLLTCANSIQKISLSRIATKVRCK